MSYLLPIELLNHIIRARRVNKHHLRNYRRRAGDQSTTRQISTDLVHHTLDVRGRRARREVLRHDHDGRRGRASNAQAGAAIDDAAVASRADLRTRGRWASGHIRDVAAEAIEGWRRAGVAGRIVAWDGGVAWFVDADSASQAAGQAFWTCWRRTRSASTTEQLLCEILGGFLLAACVSSVSRLVMGAGQFGLPSCTNCSREMAGLSSLSAMVLDEGPQYYVA